MTTVASLTTPQGRKIAYDRTAGAGPGLMFLGGFGSDMTGTKAAYLHDWALAQGRAFVRFDYSGHGQSPGRFADGCISDWLADAGAVLDQLTTGPQVLIGSSMGGWIALLLARAHPARVAALIGIAAAPDFTEALMWAQFSPDQRATLMTTGQIKTPSDYDPNGTTITRHLIEDGRRNLVLNSPLHLPFAVRLLHGTADRDVPQSLALRLTDHATSPDLHLTLVQGADHRFSSPGCLSLLSDTIRDLPGEM